MSAGELLPLATIASSLLPGVAIFFLGESSERLRATLNLAGATLKLLLVAYMLAGVRAGEAFVFRLAVLPGIELMLWADALALLFVTLSALLWLLTTVYAIGYLARSPDRSRFFGFFSICVTATVGVAMAGNLFSFLVFYELLTLSTYPLVVHRGTGEAMRAGRVYLRYTLGGGALVLLGTTWLYGLVGPVAFTQGGVVAALAGSHRGELQMIFAVLLAGLGVKAALVPLHGWLPRAMVAPVPVSALLHAVAVVKAGAFGIVRVVYEVYGVVAAQSLGLLAPLAAVAAMTIIWGSLRALCQDDLKARLAYSTVSQISYITLGIALFGPLGTIGGLVHLVHQGLMKITLFFCAGNYAETLGIHKVSEMAGVGRRMPWTTAAFTVAAFGMIGVPPLAGFVSKWYLGLGALDAGVVWALGVLIVSGLLNAAYFLPILHAAWFGEARAPWPCAPAGAWCETSVLLLAPPLVTAAITLVVGLFAAHSFSPLGWVELIASWEFGERVPGGPVR